MKIYADSHTYDGTGRAGYCPLEHITTQARTRNGVLKAWSKAARTEYMRHISFQERYDTAWSDAQAKDGIWIAEGHASDGAHRYRLTAYAEKAGALFVGAFEIPRDLYEYTGEAEHIEKLKERYSSR